MSWRAAFLGQARSDNHVRHRLAAPDIAYSHRLHYLQMVTEKLAKGLQLGADEPEPPAASHSAFVRLLQSLKGRPEMRRQLGYNDPAVFRAYINSLLEMAGRIERLAPTAAGFTHPNPEYPWQNPETEEIHAPADFNFALFDPRDPRMVKLERLVDALLRIAQ